MGISIGDIKNISQKSSQSIHDFWHVKWRNCWWWWDAPRCLIGLDSWLLALDTTCPWFFAKSGIFFSTIYVKHLIHANLFSGLFYNAELYTPFRMCALPPSGPDRTKRQQSNLITPSNVWLKNQDKIQKILKFGRKNQDRVQRGILKFGPKYYIWAQKSGQNTTKY